MRVLLLVAGLLLVAAPTAGAARVKVDNGTPARISACGVKHGARLFDPGATARVRARGRLVLQTCRNGRWAGRQRIGRRAATVTERVGDFRVRARGRRPAHLRFGAGEIVDVPFAVTVDNVNRTAAACVPDGAERVLRGHLTAPRSVLEQRRPAVTLLVHGFGYTEFFWRLRDTTARLAAGGHATVTVDRAGYGSSQTPADGKTTCLGSQADMAGQVVAALRDGEYALDGAAPVAFARTALVGHSAGGLIAQLAAGSFDGVDGLGVVSYADQAQTPLALTQLGQQGLTCAGGADYAPFGATDADFAAAHLNAPTDPAVREAVLAMNVPEPCGDVMSAAGAVVASQGLVATIEGPVLLLSGEDDALLEPAGVRLQAGRFRSADTVTTELVPDTGHALTLGRSAPTVLNALEAWLSTHEF